MNECPSEIAPEHFGHASLLFSAGRVVRQFKRMAAPLPQRRFIESRGITRKHDVPLTVDKGSEKLSMFFLVHFMSICICRRSRFVEVRWVAVEKGPGCVLTPDQLERGNALGED